MAAGLPAQTFGDLDAQSSAFFSGAEAIAENNRLEKDRLIYLEIA